LCIYFVNQLLYFCHLKHAKDCACKNDLKHKYNDKKPLAISALEEKIYNVKIMPTKDGSHMILTQYLSLIFGSLGYLVHTCPSDAINSF